MKQYLDLLRTAYQDGTFKGDRTGTGTLSIFGYQMRFNLAEGFPLVTTKKLHLRSIIHELLWFLKGDTNNESLRAEGVKIWDEWALAEDETIDVPYADYDRARLYAEEMGFKTTLEIESHFTSEYRKSLAPDAPFDREASVRFGHKLMDDAGIPRTYSKVVRPKGDLGPIYGKQWRSWQGPDNKVYDQIAWLINELKTNPDSRRLVVSAWNVAELEQMALNPCHTIFQFYALPMQPEERYRAFKQQCEDRDELNTEAYLQIREMRQFVSMAKSEFRDAPTAANQTAMDATNAKFVELMDKYQVPSRRLSCQLYQRSGDIFLGVPFNIASYALLTHMVAQVVNMAVGDFVHTLGDAHVYSNHTEQAALQLTREPLPLPKLRLNPNIKNIDDFAFDDIRVVGYDSHPAIKAPVAV